VPRAVLAALLLVFAASAAGADAAFAVEVAAGKSKNVRLRNVPGGATMAVSIVTTGKLLVALVNPQGSRTLFRAIVEHKLAFRVSVPDRGDYFLVLSNRDGSETVEVQAQIRAVRGARPAPSPQPAPRDYSPRPEKASMSPWLSSI
jgi:hypothetical protein